MRLLRYPIGALWLAAILTRITIRHLVNGDRYGR